MILNSYYSKKNNRIFNTSDGNYLIDNKGQKYLDCCFGSGALFFGHKDTTISKNIKNQVDKSILTNQNYELAHKFDNELTRYFYNKRKYFIYCNSGSEAGQRAIRYARESNNKSKVLSFKGYWHGMNEWTLNGGGSAYKNVSENVGIPKEINKLKIQINFTIEAIEKTFKRESKNISCLILETLPGSNPKKPDIETLNYIIKLCKKYNIISIFDEIISGFRCYGRGISFMLKELPDIIIYGKSLGGGLPIGVVSISEKIAKTTFLKKNSQTLAGGTFSLNPLVARAGVAFLNKLNKHNFDEIDLSNKFRLKLNEYFTNNDLNLIIEGYCSISRLIFTKKKFRNRLERIKEENSSKLMENFLKNISKKKIIYPNNGLMIHSAIYNNKDFNLLKEILIDCIEN